MARWDIAEWVGPTPNRVTGGMVESRGLVIHIMQGTYAGSVAWGKNPASSVSFHFATRGDGHLGQLVDTADTAWTQGNGNGHWISVENEGYSGSPLTAAQVEAVAQLYARGVREYGWPLQSTDSPTGRGLGWHGMGGAAWGGHLDCPGEPIKAQRGAILARATQLTRGAGMPIMEANNPLQGEIDAWRLEALTYGVDTVRGGPTKGEAMQLVRDVHAILAKLNAPTPVEVDAAAVAAALAADAQFLAAIATAVVDEEHRRSAD